MTTIGELLRQARQRLQAVSETPRLDAELLLAQVLHRDRTWLFTWPEHQPDEQSEAAFQSLLAQRERGRPVAHLLGEREFHGHRFRVTERTLIPRPDTELLVDTVLRLLPEEPRELVDLGTGTGAVGISLALARPAWRITLTDIDDDALAVARDNAAALGATNLKLLASDWLAAITGPLDAIVANPPYVADRDNHLQQGDVRFEPRRALAAGPDGLDAIRVIMEQAPSRLRPGGLLALEHGPDQGLPVRTLFHGAGFTAVATERDLGDRERVTHGRLNAQ